MLQAERMRELGLLRIDMMRLELDFLRLQHDQLSARLGRPFVKYDPNQPRVPAGNPEGGQWTSDGDGGGGGSAWAGGWLWGDNPIDPARDNPPAAPSVPFGFGSDIRIGDAPAQFVSNRPRAPGSWPGATPGQQARLAASDAQAQAAIRRVREIDRDWRPGASISEGIEGAILSNQAALRQAEARLRELQGRRLGEGPFTKEALEARNSSRNFSREERREINRIGSTFGCHSCGATNPGTTSGNFYIDHQLPTSLLRGAQRQRLLPHCMDCSAAQGGYVRPFIRRK